MVWLRVTMGAGEPNVGCFLGNGLVGVFGFVWAIATGGAGSGGVVAACVAATRLRWAVVGCNAFLKDEVVAGLGCWGVGWWCGFMSELWRLWWFPPLVCERCCG